MDKACESGSTCGETSQPKKVNNKAHWENVYKNTNHTKLGWYEENPQPSLDLIEACHLNTDSRILNVGAGATTLVDKLIDLNYNHIIATDISQNALQILRDRIKSKVSINIIADDLTNPLLLQKMEMVDLWHDRAVLHFFIEENDQNAYFDLLNSKVKLNGYVILATFNLDGATKCSGLPIKQYNTEMLSSKLGSNFELLQNFNHTYTMPSGDKRAYVYTLFKKTNN